MKSSDNETKTEVPQATAPQPAIEENKQPPVKVANTKFGAFLNVLDDTLESTGLSAGRSFWAAILLVLILLIYFIYQWQSTKYQIQFLNNNINILNENVKILLEENKKLKAHFHH